MSSEPEHREHENLDRSFAGGVAWTVAAKWITQIVSWPSLLITAHLLTKADFGIVEMAGFYLVVTNVVAEFGIGMAVLQMRELDMVAAAQLNTAAVISGVLAFGASVLAAPLLAAFFRSPQLTTLVIVASVSFIFTALQAIPLGLMQRDLNYRALSIAESAQALVTAIVSITMAWTGFAYWSLIGGGLAGRLCNVAMSYYWRPVGFARPSMARIGEPLRFSGEILAQRIAGTINLQMDGMVIGRILGQAPLGAYRLAMSLGSAPSEKIGSMIIRVTGPLFARVQDDADSLRRYYLIFSEMLATAVFPASFGLALVAPEAVLLLLGRDWAESAAPLAWLAAFTGIRTLAYLTNQLLTTLRFTRFGMWMSFLSFALLPVGFVIASRWGLGAVASVWMVVTPMTLIPIGIRVFRSIRCSLREYLAHLMPALTGCAVMAAVVLASRAWLVSMQWPVIARLSIEIGMGGAAYVLMLLVFFRQRVTRYIRFLKNLRDRGTPAVAVAAL